jgi:hypothetical protein
MEKEIILHNLKCCAEYNKDVVIIFCDETSASFTSSGPALIRINKQKFLCEMTQTNTDSTGAMELSHKI